MTTFTMPDFYVPPLGGPLNWGDEQSGVLVKAVLAFWEKKYTPEQLELTRQYCQYYINAPCWDDNPHHDDETRKELAERREEIRQAKTYDDMQEWLDKCLAMGIDPL